MLKNTKNYIFSLLLLFIILPFAQYVFCFVSIISPLEADSFKPNIDFAPPKWDTGEFQEAKEGYLNTNFGFRPWCVRLHNEWEYRLFGKINYGNGILGKEQTLFNQEYIDEYTGKNFKEEGLNEKMDKLAALKDTLLKRNILLMLVLAPSKPYYYSELLPDKSKQEGAQTYYNFLTKACNTRNIPCLNFNTYFVSQKKQTKYPLFPKTGVHWSIYGVSLAMDSLFKRIEQEKKIDMPDWDWHEMELTEVPRETDDDVMRLANLFTTFKNPTLAYPKWRTVQKEGQKKLNILTIGDSFWWNIYNMKANEEMFNRSEFWFYFRDFHAKNRTDKPDKYKFLKEIDQYDILVIESTGMNLNDLGFGFIESALDYYKNKKIAQMPPAELAKLVNEWIEKINNNPDWLQNLKEGAKKENISLDSMRHRIALYMIEKESL